MKGSARFLPRRGENNYRLYSLKDIYRLNIIRDLLTLGFSVKQIGEYLGRQNVESTLSMLEEEKEKIRQQRERLKQMEWAIGERMEHLEKFRTVEAGRFALRILSGALLPAAQCGDPAG